ncbi:hypothetical protein GCM10007887_05470 [Methylobacterium haplocladii]|uniref:PilZ domain-containing protein n=2 Tax=Methylobacterium haplocladii TaxID=1176176 RepID=A0A512IJU5_9HYPH|nr:hypothetical protein MHA02_03780 [Methylobacterium haplocladii]GJD86041.1 hypothetical protein HPGCJGGD_3938 [Methylobacterium haplocladii]GLS57891.1 hypothetical protein GCM10007887_05470 [Methylobacterium haplocladii]
MRVDSVAFIVTKTGNPVACRIKDRSMDGARLFVDSVLGIPNQFRLVVQKTGEDCPVTVVWRGPQEIGVAFLDAHGVLVVTPSAFTKHAIEIPLGPDPRLSAPENQTERPASSAEREAWKARD